MRIRMIKKSVSDVAKNLSGKLFDDKGVLSLMNTGHLTISTTNFTYA